MCSVIYHAGGSTGPGRGLISTIVWIYCSSCSGRSLFATANILFSVCVQVRVDRQESRASPGSRQATPEPPGVPDQRDRGVRPEVQAFRRRAAMSERPARPVRRVQLGRTAREESPGRPETLEFPVYPGRPVARALEAGRARRVCRAVSYTHLTLPTILRV